MSTEFLLKQGGQLFGKRGSLLNLWQEIAENFYPERADFTVNRSMGTDFAAGLATGYPVLARRDLGNSLGGMLRPSNKPWAHPRVAQWDQVSTEARAWLDRAEDRQQRAMYHRATNFTRATKEADHDFTTFGQACIQAGTNSAANGLLYRCWHLRDVAWMENTNGSIDCVYRKWKPTMLDLVRLFPKGVHERVREGAVKTPYETVEVWHCEVPADGYPKGDKEYKTPYISIYLDVQNKHTMEEVGIKTQEYIIPRWQTVSGSQYAFSPAVVVALADARTLQDMTVTLLEAGEKAVTPPMIGVREALRSDVNVMAGGLTWVDRDYDERLGEVLRPMTIDKSGLPAGFDMAQRVQQQIAEAFYLNKLALPPQQQEMTAYETGQRVQEYIRQAMPLFEPMEIEYNGPLCDRTFERLLNAGVFGSPFDMPEELRGREIEFSFESPLHDALERAKAQRYLEATALIANAAAADPSVAHIMDVKKGARDALLSSGVPAGWLRSEGEVSDLVKQDQQAQQTAALLAQMQAGANVAKTIGDTMAPSGTGGTGAAGA